MDPLTYPWRAANPHILSVEVTAAEIDDFEHVNNVVYLSWMARSAWHHSKALGFDFATYRELDCGFVVRHHELDYLAPCFEGDTIFIGTWITANDARLYLRRRFQMIRAETGQSVAEGLSDFVPMKISTGKACRMPKAFQEGYPARPDVETLFS